MINVPYLHFIDVTYGKFLFGNFAGIMMHLALQTCRFNEPAMGNISQTFNVVLKWNPESSDINVTEYTIWRKIKLDSFQEREWQLINIVSTFVIRFLQMNRYMYQVFSDFVGLTLPSKLSS